MSRLGDRHSTSRQELHPLERALLVAISFQLVALPWAWGGMRPWSHVLSFVAAATAFVLALWPRNYDDRSEGQTPFRLYTWPKLLRFPGFWLGLVFLAYVAIQALNPAWTYQTNGRAYWMEAIKYKRWLPAGMQAPFADWSPWRMLMIYAAAWLAVCAAWVGFTRRRAVQHLITTLVLNGLVMAMIALLQRVKGNGKVLWLFEPSTSYFVVTIPYKNHAASYFNLLLAATAALGYWIYLRDARRLQKSSPAPLFAFVGALIALAVVFTFSRAGALLMVIELLAVGAIFIVHEFQRGAEKRTFIIALGLLLLFGSFGAVSAFALGFDRVVSRFEHLFQDQKFMSIEARIIVRHATVEMAHDRLTYGWGAGCYRFGFPIYQLRYDRISYGSLRERLFWEHAHNDYVEWLAELGIVGCAVLAAMAITGLGYAIRARIWRNPVSAIIAAGLILTLAHAWIDFPFQNPSVLTTWLVLSVVLILWAELDDGR